MAMQTGVGLSKILIIAGAGYTGTIILKNGKLSDVLAELQLLLKRQTGDENADPDHQEAIAAQVRRLAMEVRQLGSRQISVFNGNSGQIGLSSLVVPAAALGAVGYGYMWWKGLSFSDLMYVTKRNMAAAVTNLTKHLEQVSDALAATKRHLTQRIENVDDKVHQQIEISKTILHQVNGVQDGLSQIDDDLSSLQRLVSGLEGKMGALEAKQDFANTGVMYLCNFVNGKREKMPEILQDQLTFSGARGLITAPETASLMGLKDITDIAESLMSVDINNSGGDVSGQDGIEKYAIQRRSLKRATSVKP